MDGILGRPTWYNYDILANCFSGGNITGTYVGGLLGDAPAGNTGYNCYYLLSDTVSKSIGSASGSIDSTAITEVEQHVIDSLNTYIKEDPNEIGTTGWKEWILDEDGNPNFVE